MRGRALGKERGTLSRHVEIEVSVMSLRVGQRERGARNPRSGQYVKRTQQRLATIRAGRRDSRDARRGGRAHAQRGAIFCPTCTDSPSTATCLRTVNAEMGGGSCAGRRRRNARAISDHSSILWIGFAKRASQSARDPRPSAGARRAIGRPILAGPSRKSFLKPGLGDVAARSTVWGAPQPRHGARACSARKIVCACTTSPKWLLQGVKAADCDFRGEMVSTF